MSRGFRLAAAMTCYGLLALLAGFTLDGKFRTFLWIFFSALAVRTWVAFKTERGQ
jgi:hypothetical protein